MMSRWYPREKPEACESVLQLKQGNNRNKDRLQALLHQAMSGYLRISTRRDQHQIKNGLALPRRQVVLGNQFLKTGSIRNQVDMRRTTAILPGDMT